MSDNIITVNREFESGGVCVGVLLTFVCCLAWVAVKLATGRYPLYIGGFAVSETYLGVVLACVTIPLFSRLWPHTI